MAVGRSNETEKYFGFDAFAPEIRSRCSLRQPMAPSGKIDKLSVDLTALQGIFEKIFKDLDVDPSNFEIQLSAPRSFGENVKRSIAAMLFDEFSVKAVNMAHQTVFAMRAYNAKSGVVVDLVILLNLTFMAAWLKSITSPPLPPLEFFVNKTCLRCTKFLLKIVL